MANVLSLTGNVTPEEALAHPREFAIFTSLDANKDGCISKDEIAARFRDLHVGTADANASADDVMKRIDTDGDGKISFAEFVASFTNASPELADGEGDTFSYACHDQTGKLTPWKFDRRKCAPGDIRIRITHAGICHSDIHQARGEWGGSVYPMVPGHEIAGVVVEVGSSVTKFKVGDKAGVGCFVDSCDNCKACNQNLEQFCKGTGGCVFTYNYKHADGTLEHGGYSSQHVCKADYAFKVADSMPLDRTAPLLCAGITMYSPLVYYGMNKPGMKVAIVGLGGLGHMGVKIAAAFGCEVTVISRGTAKKEDAMKLGANNYIDSTDEAAMKAAAGTIDGIIDTVSAKHDIPTYLNLLDINGTLCLVGVPPEQLEFHAFGILSNRRKIAGSLIGGRKETQEMLDFCAEKNVLADVEVILAKDVNEMYDKVVAGTVRYRAVIDIERSFA